MKKRIKVTKETREKLMRIFNCSDVLVWYALTFDERKGQSEKCQKIRTAAFQYPGTTMVSEEDFTSLHDADGVMHQGFENGAEITVDKKTGHGVLRYKGRQLAEYADMKITELEDVQRVAAVLTDDNVRDLFGDPSPCPLPEEGDRMGE